MEERKGMALDEKSMIVEQARQEKEKKRRKNRRKKRIVWAAVFVAAAGGAWYFFWGRSIGTGQAAAVTVEASAGQEIVYARLDSVRGNEIAYTVAEETAALSGQLTSGGSAAGKSRQAGEEGLPAGGTAADGLPVEDMPAESTDRSGSRQEGMNPEGAGQGSMNLKGAGQGSMNPEAASQGSMNPEADGQAELNRGSISGEGFPYGGAWFGLTEETGSALIPVGTDVITGLGAVTTFSRLRAGDYVALVMDGKGDDRQIAAVYILG